MSLKLYQMRKWKVIENQIWFKKCKKKSIKSSSFFVLEINQKLVANIHCSGKHIKGEILKVFVIDVWNNAMAVEWKYPRNSQNNPTRLFMAFTILEWEKVHLFDDKLEAVSSSSWSSSKWHEQVLRDCDSYRQNAYLWNEADPGSLSTCIHFNKISETNHNDLSNVQKRTCLE